MLVALSPFVCAVCSTIKPTFTNCTMKTSLTPVQQKVYDWIFGYMKQNGKSPTIREIMKGLGYSSPAPVQEALDRLRAKGWIDWDEGKFRAIVLVDYRFELVPVASHAELAS